MKAWFRNEDGAAAVLAAASMMLILAILAWAVDGGLGYDERRDTQSAADVAALTAAFAGPACENEDWALAGLEAADDNGFSNDGVTNTVAINNLHPGTGFGPFQAVVTSERDTAFGSFVGVDQLSVRSEAIASCLKSTGLGGYAVFASATGCPPNELKINASGITIDGGVHSNDDLLLTAGATQPGFVDGDITWVGEENISNVTALLPHTAFQWDAATLGYPPTPGGWDIDDYRPGGSAVAGEPNYFAYGSSTTLTATIPDGIYFVDGQLTLDTINATNATFVATGLIKIQGSSNTVLAPYDSTGLGVFSSYPGSPDCVGGTTAIQWSGANHTWSGVQYAPNGLVDMSGASNSAVNGSIIAYRIDLSGSGVTITYDNTYTGVEVTTLRLEE